MKSYNKQQDKRSMHIFKEDYALQKVPNSYRRSTFNIAIIFLGMATSFYFFMIGSLNVYMVGFIKGLMLMIFAVMINGIFALLGGYMGYKEGLTIDLISRAYGFGKAGSAVTSMIYTSTLIGYLAIESAILANILLSFINLPILIVYILFAFVWILPALFGITGLSLINKIVTPLFLVLLGWMLINGSSVLSLERLINFKGGLIPGGTAAALTLAMGTPGAAIITADYTRFLKSAKGVLPVTLCFVIPAFFIIPLIGALLAVKFYTPMPSVYFISIAGTLGGIFLAFLSQLKIQSFNTYSASLSLANFNAITLKFKPGRIFWVIVANLIAISIAYPNLTERLVGFLEIAGIFSTSWATIILTDFYIVKGILNIAPRKSVVLKNIRTINPIGITSLLISSIIALLLKPFVLIPSFVAMPLALTSYLIGTALTKGIYTIEKSPQDILFAQEKIVKLPKTP